MFRLLFLLFLQVKYLTNIFRGRIEYELIYSPRRESII